MAGFPYPWGDPPHMRSSSWAAPKCFMRLFAEMLRSGFRYLFALGPTVPSLFRLASVEKTRKNAHSCGRQKKKLWHISCLLQELFLGQRIRVAQVLTFPGRRFAWQTKREAGWAEMLVVPATYTFIENIIRLSHTHGFHFNALSRPAKAVHSLQFDSIRFDSIPFDFGYFFGRRVTKLNLCRLWNLLCLANPGDMRAY